MKYVVSWTFRIGGSAADNEAAVKRLLEVYSKWTIPASMTYHQLVSRVDGNGGFAVVETDNPMDMVGDVMKFGPSWSTSSTLSSRSPTPCRPRRGAWSSGVDRLNRDTEGVAPGARPLQSS